MSLVDSALKSAQKLTDSMGNGGIAAVHSSNKLFGEGFELTCLGWAIRGVDPVNLCSWEEVNHVGDNKPNELGFVRDFSYKYKINAVHYYGYPQKLQETQFFVDDLGPLKTKLREYKRKDMKEKMTVEEAMEILKESKKRAINESYLEQTNVEELYSFALEALFFADQIHLWHWTCKSGFHHTHLQEVYETLRDFADELVEICLASGKKFAVKANTRELGGDGDFDVQDAIDELEEFVDQIQAFAKDFEDETEITTLLDDEAKALTKEIGLLKCFS